MVGASSRTKNMHIFTIVIKLFIMSLPHDTTITTHAFYQSATRSVYKTIPSDHASSTTRTGPNTFSYLPVRRKTPSCWDIHASLGRQNTVPTTTSAMGKQNTKQEEQNELYQQTRTNALVYKRSKQDRLLTKDQEEFFDSLDENIY